MKNLKFIIPTLLLTIVMASCSSDDDTPEAVNEEEVITSVIVTLVSDSGTVTLSSIDLDGDGPNEPEVIVTGNLKAETTYAGAVQFLNATEIPVENITEEVEEEADEHQVFYIPGGDFDATVTYGNFDENGNPLGTVFSLETGVAATGTLNVTLRHQPTKPNDGTLADAGGETDVSVNFPVTVEE
ncbi:hypothetical protein SCB49_11342 [unidentified eubacterium SCB49]|nr:hypothetical protein SCB49_11342 [unidentified eubacterium SCB49]